MVLEPLLQVTFSDSPAVKHVATGGNVAHAAESGAGAPPAIDAYLPDVGMRPSSSNATPSTTPQATPGVSSPVTAFDAPTTTNGAGKLRTLPPIGAQNAPANTNSTQTSEEGRLNREMLARKQEELNRKEQELVALQKEITDKLERMQLLENRLNVMMKDAQDTNDAKFRHLVDVLTNMKAKSAAQVLESLDQRTAVKVLAGMRGRQAGEILTFVRPEVAASLTEALTRMQLPLE